MPDYRLYQLANSTEIPRYVGSVVPELTQVGQILQGRYDVARNQEDMLDQATRNATSLVQDQKILNDLKGNYKERIKARAAKGDYENMVRETALDARDFVQQYKPIAANQQAVSEFMKGIEDQVTAGKMSRGLADQWLAYNINSYKGLQKDPVTGEIRGGFQGKAAAKEVDISDFTKKALQDLNPTTIGSDVRKDINGFYRQIGGKRVTLGWNEIQPHLEAYKAANPEYQAFAKQNALLAGYGVKGLTEEAALKQFGQGTVDRIWQGAREKGLTFGQAAENYAGDMAIRNLDNQVNQMGHKYIRNDRETWDRNMGETEKTGRDEAAKLAKTTPQFGVRFAATDTKGNVNTAVEFTSKIQAATQTAETAKQQQLQWLRNPNIRAHTVNGITTYTEVDPRTGKSVDVTAQGAEFENAIKYAERQAADLRNVNQAAMDDAKFNPANVTQEAIGKAVQSTLQSPSVVMSGLGNAIKTAFQMGIANITKNPEDIVNLITSQIQGNAAQKELIKNELEANLAPHVPRYKEYQQALKNRVNGSTQENSMIAIDDDNARKDLGNIVTGLAGNGIGLKQGLLGITIGTGKNQGTQLTADEYNSIAGDLNVVGVSRDLDGGDYEIILRSNQEIKGKKVLGENLIVKTKDITGIDSYLKKNMAPVDYKRNEIDGQLKSMLGKSTNTAGVTNYPIYQPGMDTPLNIEIKRVYDKEQVRYEVTVPTQQGLSKRVVNGLAGVNEIIMLYQYGVEPQSKQ